MNSANLPNKLLRDNSKEVESNNSRDSRNRGGRAFKATGETVIMSRPSTDDFTKNFNATQGPRNPSATPSKVITSAKSSSQNLMITAKQNSLNKPSVTGDKLPKIGS